MGGRGGGLGKDMLFHATKLCFNLSVNPFQAGIKDY